MPNQPTNHNFRLDIRNISTATLEYLVQEMNQGVTVKNYELISHAACGDGIASTADRINLSVQYEKNDANLPETLILKTLLLNPLLRLGLPAILSLSTLVNAMERLPLIGEAASRLLFLIVGVFQKYFPQAPDAMYEIESRFYREIRLQLDIDAPEVYGARYDNHTRQFAILMEDLTLRGARFPNAIDSLPLATIKSTIKQMALIHARFWQSDELNQSLNWIPTRMTGGMFPVFDGIGFDLVRYQVEQNSFKSDLISPIDKTVKELWQANWKSQELLASGPQTLLHGDTHVGNTYVLPDGEGGLLDFQLLVKGNWCIDICYYIMTALDIQSRRMYEKDLYDFYLQELVKLNVPNVPSFEEAWHDHRLASIWGLVIGWLITPPVNYGIEVTAANVERLAQAVIDLEAFAALEELPIRNTRYKI
jgi:hypothetical protein